MLLARAASRHAQTTSQRAIRPLTRYTALLDKALPPRRKVLDAEIEESFLKGSGPGGQKINKTNSAVQLKHLPTGIVVKCQDQRSREFNRKVAREILGEKLDELEKGEQSRTALKLERARKKKASSDKKSKRKYRKLEEERRDEGRSRDVDAASTAGPNMHSAREVSDTREGDRSSDGLG